MEENWCVFCIAIFRNITVEQAFDVWKGRKPRSNSINLNDVEDMQKMRQDGMTYKAIGEIYGIGKDAVFRRLKEYRNKKDRSIGVETVSKEISYSY